jgi:ankyrin repeat protein
VHALDFAKTGRTRSHRATALLWLSWLTLAPAAWGAQCVVQEPDIDAAPPPPPKVVPPIRVVIGAEGVSALEGSKPAGGHQTESEDAAQQRRRAIWATIRSRDLDAFLKLMPSNPKERRALLLHSHALSFAFRGSALPIVRQILEWEPDALTNSDFVSTDGSLLPSMASTWADLDRRRRAGQPAPRAPTADDQVELFRLLLDAGADGNGSKHSKSPVAILAGIPASPQTVSVARMLLNSGASIERNQGGFPAPLAEAAEKQNVEFVLAMLAVRQPSQDALDEAILRSPIVPSNGAIRPLLERGANVNADALKYGISQPHPVWQAASRVWEEGGRDLMRLLVRYKADPNRVVNKTDSPLMMVTHDHELMRGLLELGANANYRTYTGETPLHRATRVPIEVVRMPGDHRPLTVIAPALDPQAKATSVAMLLKHGADPNGVNGSGVTPLMLTGSDDTGTVKLLLERGATIIVDDTSLSKNYRHRGVPLGLISWSLLNYKDALAAELTRRSKKIPAEDCGAVFYAAYVGATRALSALLDRKATTVLESNMNRLTPLIVAAKYGQTASVKILLDRRAAKVNESTSVQIARMPGNIVPILPIVYGRQTALMLAAEGGHTETVKELLRRGADVKRVDTERHTAVDYAREGGHKDIVALLQSH